MSGVRTVIDRADRISRSMSDLADMRLLVGVPAATASRSGAPINNATIAFINDNGSPAMGIPARPFLMAALKPKRGEIERRLKLAANEALDGKMQDARSQMDALGIYCVNIIRAKITTGPFLPLAPRTLAERRARGRTGTRPLIDTGKLRQSISYVLKT